MTLPTRVKVCGPPQRLVQEAHSVLTESTTSSQSRFHQVEVCALGSTLLSLVSDVRPLTEELLHPGVFVCCYGDLPERSCLLRRLMKAAVVADTVSPKPPSSTEPRFPNHLLILVDSRTCEINAEDSAFNDWLLRVESTYDEISGKVDADTMLRNDMKMLVSALFLSVKVRRFSAKEYGASAKLSNEVDLLIRQCPKLEMSRKKQLCRRLAEYSEPSAVDTCAASCFQWAETAAMSMVQVEFVEFCSVRLHRMTSDSVRRRHDEVVGRCRTLLVSSRSPTVSAAIHTMTTTASTALDELLLVLQRVEEERVNAQREAASLSRTVQVATIPLPGFLARYVPQRYHFWFSRTGVGTVLMIALFVLGALAMRPKV